MREIKFRVWCKNRNEWEKDVCFIGLDGNIYQQRFASPVLLPVNMDNHVIMQFTGLKDRNGVEIYEGDVVHFNHNQMSGLGFVYWNNGLGQWWIKDIREATKKRGQRYYPFWKDCKYRVDGNIYENPELLETKKD